MIYYYTIDGESVSTDEPVVDSDELRNVYAIKYVSELKKGYSRESNRIIVEPETQELYYVRVKNGQLYDHQASIVKDTEPPAFNKVPQTSFNMYVEFLKTKRRNYYDAASRLIVQ